MSSDGVLRCRGLGKTFNVYRRPIDRAAEMLSFGLRRFHRPFEALEDVGFTLARGESVAVLGINGSGKSTLLQILAGTMSPSRGRIEVEGRIAALLELGAGFIGEVTARENAVLAARLYGMTEAEALERLPWIASFSGLEDHLGTPVKFFSSGMYARLAFAVAVAVKPDVILIDEALSVGDVGFQRKAEAYLRDDLADAAKVIVSHDQDAIARHCTRALVLERGRLVYDGPVEGGLRHVSGETHGRGPAPVRRVRGEMEVSVAETRLLGGDAGTVSPGSRVEIEIELESRVRRTVDCVIGHFWSEGSGRELFGASTESLRKGVVKVPPGRSTHRLVFDWPACAPGVYRLNLGVYSIGLDGVRTTQCRVEDAASLIGVGDHPWGTTFLIPGAYESGAPAAREKAPA